MGERIQSLQMRLPPLSHSLTHSLTASSALSVRRSTCSGATPAVTVGALPDNRTWLTLPLTIGACMPAASHHRTIQLEPGVTVEAIRWAYTSLGAVLFTAENVSGFTLHGAGATLKMWRSDYANASLCASRPSHVIAGFRVCSPPAHPHPALMVTDTSAHTQRRRTTPPQTTTHHLHADGRPCLPCCHKCRQPFRGPAHNRAPRRLRRRDQRRPGPPLHPDRKRRRRHLRGPRHARQAPGPGA